MDNLPILNLLTLSYEVRQRIKGWMDDFYGHRQATVLLRKIDTLMDTLLNSGTAMEYKPLQPVQLRLLDPEGTYTGTTERE